MKPLFSTIKPFCFYESIRGGVCSKNTQFIACGGFECEPRAHPIVLWCVMTCPVQSIPGVCSEPRLQWHYMMNSDVTRHNTCEQYHYVHVFFKLSFVEFSETLRMLIFLWPPHLVIHVINDWVTSQFKKLGTRALTFKDWWAENTNLKHVLSEEWKAQFIKAERRKLLNYKAQLVKDLQPRIYCPFAGYFVESHPSDK